MSQLRDGGRLVLPFRLNGTQVVVALERRGADLASLAAAAGGFMPLRGASGRGFVAELGDNRRISADVDPGGPEVAALAKRWDAGRAVALPALAGGDRWFDALAYLALQGAPLASVLERGLGVRAAAWRLLVTSPASALRWRAASGGDAPGAPGTVEVLGSDEALDFARAALMRWSLEGEPHTMDLSMRVSPAAHPGSLGELPRPVAGRYRCVRGDRAYELWFERGNDDAGTGR